MDPGTTTITVSGVAGAATWDGPNATFVPSSPPSYGTKYDVTVAGEGPAGNSITFSWSFTTTNMGTISGIVRDDNGKPLAGAKVTLDGGQEVVTDATGHCTFQALAGTHELRITKPGWDPQTVEVDPAAGQICAASDKSMVQSDVLGLLGIAAAIVALLYCIGQRRRKDRGPPTPARSRGHVRAPEEGREEQQPAHR